MSANRLERRLGRLRAEGRRGIAPYLTAGDGGPAATLAALRGLDRAGAVCVELGLPFSDPIADGPLLQAAAGRALAAGTHLDGVLEIVRALRAGGAGEPASDLPVVLFSYANPLLARGWTAAARAASEAGLDGWLVPDLPVEEGTEMRAAAAEHGLCPIFFVAPTTDSERARAALHASRGFLYAIGRFGVTGARTTFDQQAVRFLRRLSELGDLPIGVGFGLSGPADVRAVLEHAELAIVGSALVEHLHQVRARQGGADPDRLARATGDAARAFLEHLAGGLPAPTQDSGAPH